MSIPAQTDYVPREVWNDLLRRSQDDLESPTPRRHFRGSLLDDKMFAIDVDEWGMRYLLEESANSASRRLRRRARTRRAENAGKPMRIAALADLHFTPQLRPHSRADEPRAR